MSNNNLTLYGPDYSTYTRTLRMCMEEKGLAYQLENVDLLTGQNQSAEHLARQPFAKVPAFSDGDFVIYETQAVLDYLESIAPSPSLVPADAKGRARMRQIQCVSDGYAYASCIGGVFWQRAVEPMIGGQTDEDTIREAMPAAQQAMTAINALASGGGFLVGDQISLADCALVPVYDYVQQIPDGEEVLNGCDNLKAWWSSISTRASVEATAPQLG